MKQKIFKKDQRLERRQNKSEQIKQNYLKKIKIQ